MDNLILEPGLLDMWKERFTDPARRVVLLSGEEARAFGHNKIGTEHILLGLLREQEGLAARVLDSFGVTVESVRAQVTRILAGVDKDTPTPKKIPLTPRAKKVLELALREALSLGHNYISTEHILLGLVRENEGVAARILLDFDAQSETVRNEVIRLLSGPGGRRRSPEEQKTARIAENRTGLEEALARAARKAAALTADGLDASGVELHVTCAQGAAACDLPSTKS